MCLGNRAENSAFYINSQLKALWENAQRCTEHYGTNLKPVHNEIEFNTCLYEFYGPGRHDHGKPRKRDLHFYAKFGIPRLEFMCNHEVVLYLHLKEGHYKANTHRPTAKGVPIHDIDNITLAFRLDFDNTTLDSFKCEKIGDKDYTMNLFILNMFTGSFLLERSDLKSIATADSEEAFREKETRVDALVHWISRFYFPLLKRAGLHVYHALPDFAHSNSVSSSHVDYSVMSSAGLAAQEIAGVRVEDVNEYLKGLWLQAAAYIDEHPVGDEFDHNSPQYYLAEHKSSWSGEDCHFHMYFGPMNIRTLCRREVILYININELEVRFGSGFSSSGTPYKLEDWSVALIVDAYSESAEDNNVKRIKVKLASTRSCGPLSKFPRGDVGTQTLDEKTFARIKSSLERYITEHFVRLMQESGHDCIYERDLRVAANPDSNKDDELDGEPDEDEECTCPELNCGHTASVVPQGVVENNRDQIKISDVDQVFSITQGAVNAHFYQLWQTASDRVAQFGNDLRSLENKKKESQFCLAEYFVMQEAHGNEVFFSSSFSAPKVQLVLNANPNDAQTVIFYLNLKEGNLKTLGTQKALVPGGEVYGFTNWRLAFHVNLNMIDCADGDVDDDILKLTGRSSGRFFKRLVLDFKTAKFDQKLSQVPGLLDGTDFRLIRHKREALIHYMHEEYFAALTRAKHHVILTIPIRDPDGQGNHPQIPTDIKVENYPFYVHPNQPPREGISGKFRRIYDRNMILIRGMKGDGKMPDGPMPRNPGITIGSGLGEATYGTICLSRDAFLQTQVLNILTDVNKQTTILPAFSGISRNQWDLKLTTWEKHHVKKDLDCTWRQVVKDTPGDLKFEWTNRDDWRYIHEGEFNHNGTFEVKCNTTNTLRIPVGRRHGLSRIPLEGRLDIELSYQDQGYPPQSQSWSGKINVIWLAVIELVSDSFHGVQVRLSPEKVEPRFRDLGPNNSIFQSVLSKLKEIFPSAIDFSPMLSGLRASFDGIHSQIYIGSRRTTVCDPVFTQHGDLLLDIVPRGAEGSSHHKNANGTTTYTLSATGKEVVIERNPPKPLDIPSPQFSPTDTSPYSNLVHNQTHSILRSPSPHLPYLNNPPSPGPNRNSPVQHYRPSTPPLPRPSSRNSRSHEGDFRTPSPSRAARNGQSLQSNPPFHQPQGSVYHYQLSPQENVRDIHTGVPNGRVMMTGAHGPPQTHQVRNNWTGRQQASNQAFIGTTATQAFLPHEIVQNPQLRQYMPGSDSVLTTHRGN